MSNNIGRTEVSASQNQKEVTINDSDGRIDAALTELLTSDYTSADVTLTTAQFQQAMTFVSSNLTVARALNVPQVKKLFVVDNSAGTATLTVTRGAGTVAVLAGEVFTCYTDGTTNGIVNAGGGGGASDFLSLTDTPSSFSGQEGNVPTVNAAENALEFPSEISVFIPATEFTPTASGGSAALATVASGANLPDITSLNFDATTAEHMQFSHVFDKAKHMGNVSLKFIWSHAAATTFGVHWNVKATAVSDDQTIGSAFGTSTSIEDAGGTTDDLYITDATGFVTIPNIAQGALVVFDVFRDPTATIDTLDVDARLQGAMLTYRTDVALDANWANVVLLLGFDGSDGATDIGDSSASQHALTYTNGAQVDTAKSKFGGGSLLTDGTNDIVTTPDSADWAFGSGNFTIEAFVNFNTDPSAFQIMFGQWDTAGSQKSFALVRDGVTPALELFLSSNGSTSIVKVSGSWSPTLNTWYHLAADWDGTTYRVYVDGAVMGTATGSVTLFDSTAVFSVGDQAVAATDPFDGNIDELRVTKGVARYAGAFTAPTKPFPRG